MKNKIFTIQMVFRIVLVAIMFIAALILYPSLPQIIPTHWSFDGTADGFGDKTWGVFISPFVALAMLIFFPLLPLIDPRKENYEKFGKVWDLLQTVFIIFFGYIFILQMYFTFHTDESADMGKFMMGGIGVLFILIGNYLGKIRQNYFIGIKTPWAINDPEVWQKSQRFGGWVMLIAGIGFLIEAFVWFHIIEFFIVAVAAIIILPTAYSFIISKKK